MIKILQMFACLSDGGKNNSNNELEYSGKGDDYLVSLASEYDFVLYTFR